MITKFLILSSLTASTLCYSYTAVQDPGTPSGSASHEAIELDAIRGELTRLRDEMRLVRDGLDELLADSRGRIGAAEQAKANLEGEVAVYRDLLQETRRHRRSCTPSRRLLTLYNRALHEHQSERGADLIAQEVLAEVGSKTSSMNSFCWSLLTKEKYGGKYNELALKIAETMQSKGSLQHAYLDTVALAKFRNGMVDEAIAIQEQAIERAGRHVDGDYKKRLATYVDARCEPAVPGIAATIH